MTEREKLLAAILNAQSREVGLPELSLEQHNQANPHSVARAERLLSAIEAEAVIVPREIDDETARPVRERDGTEREMIAWRSAVQSLTPGGSEFTSPQAVIDWARRFRDEGVDAKKGKVLAERRATDLSAQLAAKDAEVVRLLSAIEAVAPMIRAEALEEAARVADRITKGAATALANPDTPEGMRVQHQAGWAAGVDAAAAIRAMGEPS